MTADFNPAGHSPKYLSVGYALRIFLYFGEANGERGVFDICTFTLMSQYWVEHLLRRNNEKRGESEATLRYFGLCPAGLKSAVTVLQL